MLTQEKDVDAHALRKSGWSISAIARHLGHDQKTIRSNFNGEREAGVRVARASERSIHSWTIAVNDSSEDPHLWAMTLFDEVVVLGFTQSYPTFTRQVRVRSLRPHCERCSAAKGARWRSSITLPVRKPSGTGLIFLTRRRRGEGA